MKPFIKLFFKTVRLVLGPFMLLGELLSRPRSIKRLPEVQAVVDQQCQSLALYQFKTCPFSIKVRQEMRRLSLPIERCDAQHDAKHRADLVLGLGSPKVPCLKITETSGAVQWLSESDAIIGYLRGRFAAG